ncbi:MAG: glycosyltransferase family 4 protein [Phycisphaerae bacterium]|jgi:glycosyltransferase involved in cell wall biosynthesis
MPGKRAKILYVSTAEGVSGAEKSLLLLVRHMGEHEVFVACPAGSPLAQEVRASGGQDIALPASRWQTSRLGRLVGRLRAGLRLRDIVGTIDPDIIHANSIYAMLPCIVAARGRRAKLIWQARDFAGSRTWVSLCGWLSDKVIAVSQSVAQWLRERGVDDSKIEVIYNGLDPAGDPLRAGGGVQGIRLEGQGFAFANIGQFVPWKNQLLFLRAAERVQAAAPQAKFLLVGDDLFGRDSKYRRRLEGYVQTHGLSEVVTFAGWREDMSTVWPLIDCLVHTAQREPFGRVIIEAMDAGVPVISADAGGPGEIIDNERTGLLVSPDDVEKLAGAMLRMVWEAGLAARLAAAAIVAVRAEFTAAETARRVSAVYAEILQHSCAS